jgi:g-D-glutamyl-meso-diaminopimelate peptidase
MAIVKNIFLTGKISGKQMTRKAITCLSGEVFNNSAVLSWYKSTPFFEAGEEQNQNEFNEFKIYRKQCDKFEFNKDYAEFFCDLMPNDSDLIFQGSLDCSNNRKYTFRDSEVEIGKTYAYFVRSKNTQWIGPVPLKVRDSRVWWSYEELCRQIELLKKDFSKQVKLSICGKTVEGRSIHALKIGSGKPFLGLVGAVHPGEAGPELMISALRQFLATNPEILKFRSILAIPSVNIDVREQLVKGIPWYLRKNIAGVDLNRNFPADWKVVAKNYGFSSDDRGSATYRGMYPASEPETQAVIKFFLQNTPKCIFSYHALAGICDLPGLTAGGDAASDKEFCKLAESYIFAYGSGLHPELKPNASWWCNGGTEGGFTRWAWLALNIPAFDMEFSPIIASETHKRCIADLTDIKLLNEYTERHCHAIKRLMSHDMEGGLNESSKN